MVYERVELQDSDDSNQESGKRAKRNETRHQEVGGSTLGLRSIGIVNSKDRRWSSRAC